MRFTQLSTAAVLAGLSAASAIPSLSTRSAAPSPVASEQGGLKPLKLSQFQRLSRRQQEELDFASLDPAQQAELLYGTPGENGQMVLANMQLKAPQGHPIVMMENFERLTSAVECNGDDHTISLTFKSQRAIAHAEKKWKYMHEDDETEFLIITNHDGCNPADQRQPYFVKDVTTDEKTMTTYLKVEPVEWSAITGNYRIDFGMSVPAPQHEIQARGFRDWFGEKKDEVKDWWNGVKEDGREIKQDIKETAGEVKDKVGEKVDDLKDKVEEKVDDLKDHIDISKEKSTEWDLAAGTPGQKHNIFTGPFVPALLTLDCMDCYTQGKFKLAGKVVVEDADVKELSVLGSFQDFKAVVKLDTYLQKIISPEHNTKTMIKPGKSIFSFSDAEKQDKLEADVDLIQMPVPGAGVAIPGVFALGLMGTIEAGFALLFKGYAGFQMGVEAGLPDEAEFFLDLVRPENSYATGFERAHADSSFEINNASVTVDASVFFRPKLELTAELTGLGKVAADIFLNLPVINVNGTAAYDVDGVCPDSDQPEVKTGAKFATGGRFELVTGTTIELGPISGRPTLMTLASHSMFEKSICVPMDIAGFFDDMEDGSQEAPVDAEPELPAPETPAPETPAPETPAPEVPAEVPSPEVPAEVPSPEVPSPEVPAPEVPAPEVTTPGFITPEVPAPEVPAPEVPAPEVPAPEVPAPEVPAAEVPAAEGEAQDLPVV